MISDDYPAIYRSANNAAVSKQTTFFVLLTINLSALILVSTWAALGHDEKSTWLSCGLLLIANFVLTLWLMFAGLEKDWYDSRSIAESTKTATWRFVTRAKPFDVEDSKEARASFVRLLRTIADPNNTDVRRRFDPNDGDQISKEMLRIRGLCLKDRIEEYRVHRIRHQQNWYIQKSRHNRRWFFILMSAILLTMLIAAGLFFYRAMSPEGWKIWVGEALITLTVSIISWVQAKRYRELSESYSVTSQDIGFVLADLESISTEEEFSDFVGDSENAFSREHTKWVARRDG